MDIVMVVVIVMCALLLGVIVGWVSRGADRCPDCGRRLTCNTCQSGARLRISATTTARLTR